MQQAEFRFLQNTLVKVHLQCLLLTLGQTPEAAPDMGLRHFLGHKKDYHRFFEELPQQAQSNTIYKLTDSYLCNYLFLRLPDSSQLLLIGPYLTVQLSHQQLLQEAERYALPPHLFHQLETYYGSLPYLSDEAFLFAAVNTFAESIWGSSDAYSLMNLTLENLPAAPLTLSYEPAAPRQTLLNMQAMERRYAYENEMRQAVSQGLSHKAQLMLSHLSAFSMEQRAADPVRNLKNYSIIMNSLLRKAAERGGVHPLYLDSVSSDFARRIEVSATLPSLQSLMADMMQSYCRLVKKHAMVHYSAPVRKTLACIDADLTGDLTLHTLAELQNLSPGYLSALFKKEVGQPLTVYVNRKRMEHAATLLRSGTLQVQTVAQYCGIPDVNYFSKLFKRHTGLTPKEYRTALHTRSKVKK